VGPVHQQASLSRGDLPTAPPGGFSGPSEATVTAIYSRYYRPLVRQAAVLVQDGATAEDIVQDVFATMQGRWGRLHDSDKTLAYLRRCVTNRSWSLLRHQSVVDRHPPMPAPDTPSAEESALTLLERYWLISALNTLAPRQRQALTLRYYAGLTETQIAAVMGISPGAVKSHTARARVSLRAALLSRALGIACRRYQPSTPRSCARTARHLAKSWPARE
jgi:RNA polymerase sigma-70 factor (sigma-E family)